MLDSDYLVSKVFQSTHPSGVRLCPSLWRSTAPYFNPRTPVGCDPHTEATLTDVYVFQSTHPSGVRLGGDDAGYELPGLFQSTHPSGVRRSVPSGQGGGRIFQSTHPSGVRRDVSHFITCLIMISIHAPQWGATEAMGGLARTEQFQSTHPSGVRPGNTPIRRRQRRISIHAPQWGATDALMRGACKSHDFNPRTPVGCDWHECSPEPYS